MYLHDKIWITKKSRIQASQRLLLVDLHSQLILIWYAVFSVSASIYLLKFDHAKEYTDILLIIYSILVLCASLFISGRNFKQRAMLLKQCVEKLGHLYIQAKQAQKESKEEILNNISREYHEVLSVSENHSDSDYKRAVLELWIVGAEDITVKLTKAIIAQVIVRLLCFYMFIMALYILPIASIFLVAYEF